MARAAGVSTATVSRVLNSPNRVASETADRVQDAIRKLGYRPNVFAQGLMTKKSRVIGILLPDIHGEFYSELLRGADAEARRQGFHLLISSESVAAHEAPDAGPSGGTLLNSNIVGFLAGLAVMLTEPNDALWEEVRTSGLPLVVIDEAIHGNGKLDRVLVDNQTGTREAVEHLLESVHPSRLYFIGGPKENFDTAERAQVFSSVLAKAGHKVTPDQMQFGEYNVEWGHRAGEQVLARGVKEPIGVLAANDEIAFGVMQAAAEKDVHVPRQMRIVGFDDTRLASLLRPQLSTVRVPTADLGVAAVRALIERVNDPERASIRATLPTRLVVRGTSRPG